MGIRKVGIVGSGVMGWGIAQVCATHGYEVHVVEADASRLEAGVEAVRSRLARDVEKARLSRERYERAVRRLSGTTSLADLSECDIVIEAVTEGLGVKQALFSEMGAICGPSTILASNTSSMSLSALAAASGRPDRVIGLHFFNPPTVLALVEVISSESTSKETIEASMSFCDALDS